ATQITTRYSFVFAQPLLDCCLSRNPGMIHTWQPEHFESQQPRTARENILNGIVEHVAKRKNASDVWWRHHDRERRLRRIRGRYENAILHPTLMPFRFNRFWIVSLRELSHCDQSSKAGARLQISGPRRCEQAVIAPYHVLAPRCPNSAR